MKWVDVKRKLPEEFENVICYGSLELCDEVHWSVEPTYAFFA